MTPSLAALAAEERPMVSMRLSFCRELLSLLLIGVCAAIGRPQQPAERTAAAADATRAFVNKYCVDCHNRDDKTAGLTLDDAALEIAAHTELWEKVVRKLRVRHMPPAKMPRPDEPTYQTILASLEAQLDRAAAKNPNPGRIETFRRLNRIEY